MKTVVDAFVWEYLTCNQKKPPIIDKERDRQTEVLVKRIFTVEYVLENLDKQALYSTFTNSASKRFFDTQLNDFLEYARKTYMGVFPSPWDWLVKTEGMLAQALKILEGQKVMPAQAHLFKAWHLWRTGNKQSEPIDTSPKTFLPNELLISLEQLENRLGSFLAEMAVVNQNCQLIGQWDYIPPQLIGFRHMGAPEFFEAVVRIIDCGDSALTLPFFKSPENQRFYAFWPYGKQSPFLNAARLDQPGVSVAILTSSLRLADINQKFLDKNGIPDFLWLSWNLDDAVSLDSIDWKPLVKAKARLNTYFLLRTYEDMQSARTVKEKLEKLGMHNLRYVSYLPDKRLKEWKLIPSDETPVILNNKEFGCLVSSITNPLPRPETRLENHMAVLKKIKSEPRKSLLNPVVHEKTLTLVHGDHGGGRTWLALTMAQTISLGKNMLETWRAPKPRGVLYICAGPPQELREKIESLTAEIDTPSIIRVELPGFAVEECSLFKINNNLYFASLRGNQINLTDYSHLAQLKKCLSSNLPEISVVIMDGYLNGLVGTEGHPYPVYAMSLWSKELKQKNIALMLVCSGPPMAKKKMELLKRHLPFDSILEVKKRNIPDASKTGMTVRIEKAFRFPDDELQRLNLSFSPTASGQRWLVDHHPLSKEEAWDKIKKMLRKKKNKKPLTNKAIACELGISPAMVGKHISEMREKLSSGTIPRRRAQKNSGKQR